MELKKGGQKSRPPSATQAGCRALTVLALPRRATLYTRNPSPQLSPLAPGRLQLCAQQLRRNLARTEGPGAPRGLLDAGARADQLSPGAPPPPSQAEQLPAAPTRPLPPLPPAEWQTLVSTTATTSGPPPEPSFLKQEPPLI